MLRGPETTEELEGTREDEGKGEEEKTKGEGKASVVKLKGGGGGGGVEEREVGEDEVQGGESD